MAVDLDNIVANGVGVNIKKIMDSYVSEIMSANQVNALKEVMTIIDSAKHDHDYLYETIIFKNMINF